MNRSTNRVFILSVSLLLLALISISGEGFSFSADKVHSRLAEGREFTVLSNGARIVSDGTTIEADTIELWGGKDLRYSMATGGVTAVDEERGIILKSERLFYDRTDEIIRVDGFIDMQDLKNDVVIRGGFFEYFGKDEIAYIQIGVRILKVDEDTELACRSEFARYMRNEDLLELSGMPRVIRNEDLYSAARISINLETDEIRLDGDVSGTVVTNSEQETPAEASSEASSVPVDPAAESPATPREETPSVFPEEQTEDEVPEEAADASSVPEKPPIKKEKLPPSPESEEDKS